MSRHKKPRIITHPPGTGHQPAGKCPGCGGNVLKGALRELVYVCKDCKKTGPWDSRTMGVDRPL